MKKILLAIPSFLAAVVAAAPILTCPACWPLYAGLLSSLGVGFVDYTPYILPATLVMLAFALAALGWKANQRRGYSPLFLGVIASGLLVGGKFYLNHDWLFYAGAALLIGASIWNIWPKKNCKVCTT